MSDIFANDDQGYLSCLERHPGGFVLNIRSLRDPSYVVLHRATCPTIRDKERKREPGAFTARGYRKVCAESLEELRLWARAVGREDGSFSKLCRICAPELSF